MIGNDIVDLSMGTIGDGERRVRFMKKLFTNDEMDIIESLGKDDKWIWLLWSIKESVYKIVFREEQKTRYAPKSLKCISMSSSGEGIYHAKVDYEGFYFESRSIISREYIHTIASKSLVEIDQSTSEIFTIPSKKNENIINNKIVESVISSKKYELASRLSIIKDKNRIPHLYDGVDEIGYLSISHHGRFGAFAILEDG